MQYRFDFSPDRPGFSSLVIGPANRGVIERLQQPGAWPTASLCVVGPPRSGRSSMARAWACEQLRDGEGAGVVLQPDVFNAMPLPELDQLSSRRVALDDAHLRLDDDRLLHLLNRAGERGGTILLTAGSPPVSWQASQRDLVSRLKAMSVATIGLPDEEMMRDLFEMTCHSQYLGVPDDVWSYLARRIPRDYAAIEALASEMCALVSGSGRGLTVPVAREVLGDTGDPEGDGEETDD